MIATDKIFHFVIGVGTCAYALLIVWITHRYGFPLAAAVATTLMGIGIELYQRVRKEGAPDPRDAIATAVPGWVYYIVSLGTW